MDSGWRPKPPSIHARLPTADAFTSDTRSHCRENWEVVLASSSHTGRRQCWATGSWASDDKKLHRHDPRLSVMGPNQIFIIDTHPLLAQNYAKPWYTRDMACFGKSLEVSIAYEKRESKPRTWSQVGAQAERDSVYTDLVKLKA